MIRFLLDEHVPPTLIPGLLAREPEVDVVRVQDVGLRSADDRVLLAWASSNTRAIVSRDRKTLIGFAYARVAAGQSFAGLVIYDPQIPFARMVEDLLLVAAAYDAAGIRDQVVYLPL